MGTKKEYLLTGLRNVSITHLCYVFENVVLPEGLEEGEYLCALYKNNRHDTEYTFNDDLLETEIATRDGTVKVRHLRAELFILKVGNIPKPYVARPKNNEYYYYNG